MSNSDSFSWNAKTYSDLTLLRDVFFTGWLLLHRPGTAPPRSVMAVLAPRREAMCFSSRRLSSLPSLSQRWADAASILHGVVVTTTHFSRFPYARCRWFRRWPVKGSSGWSRPMLPDHAELAATEQAQREAAWARGSSVDPSLGPSDASPPP